MMHKNTLTLKNAPVSAGSDTDDGCLFMVIEEPRERTETKSVGRCKVLVPLIPRERINSDSTIHL